MLTAIVGIMLLVQVGLVVYVVVLRRDLLEHQKCIEQLEENMYRGIYIQAHDYGYGNRGQSYSLTDIVSRLAANAGFRHKSERERLVEVTNDES